MRLRSRTVPGCRDCMRRWDDPLANGLSGDGSPIRFARTGTKALSRAFSVKAACADWIALEVPARDVRLGDCGLRGRGGGALSGSELSHLLFPSQPVLDGRHNMAAKAVGGGWFTLGLESGHGHDQTTRNVHVL
jgi:hypothetical protein